MNEQELTDKAEAFVRDQGNTHSGLADRPRIICWMSSFAKAYADARESKEIAELKATVIQAQQMYTDLLVGTTDAINAKDAEIKLLREFAKQCQKSPEKLVKMNWFEDGSFDYCDLIPLQEAAASVLSPAPVTETKNKEQE